MKELALYIQDSITVKNWNFNIGLRADLYNGLAEKKQLGAAPRRGI